jgi:membrane protein
MEKIEFETVLVESAKLPMVKIDRELFLRKELKGRFAPEIVEKAIQYSPAYAGISVEDINKIAKSCITAETTRVTAISAAAGIPGGFALIGTIPADLTQYFAHILRIVQELIYLYGWQDLNLATAEMNQETKNLLTLFVGIMFGVNGAVNAINNVAAQIAKQVAKTLPQKALTKGMVYPIVKRVARLLGVKMTKQIFSKGVAKVVPIIGAAISGGLTFVTYKPMSEKLRKYLASSELASVEYYQQMEDEVIVDAEI